MNSAPIPSFRPRPTLSSKMKWRLGLLVAVAIVALLPTLFLVVRTLSKPQAMQLSLPAKTLGAPVGVPAEALTILVGSGSQLYYYFGAAAPTAADSLHATTSARPIGPVLKAWQQRRKATVFIKPGEPANYKVLANLLDELNSSGQRSYAVVAATAADRQLLAASEKQ